MDDDKKKTPEKKKAAPKAKAEPAPAMVLIDYRGPLHSEHREARSIADAKLGQRVVEDRKARAARRPRRDDAGRVPSRLVAPLVLSGFEIVIRPGLNLVDAGEWEKMRAPLSKDKKGPVLEMIDGGAMVKIDLDKLAKSQGEIISVAQRTHCQKVLALLLDKEKGRTNSRHAVLDALARRIEKVGRKPGVPGPRLAKKQTARRVVRA